MHTPDGERGLILVLAGGICLHHWQRLLGWIPLALPSAAGLWLNRRWLYVGLPLLWALLLARHLPLGMLEGGTVLPAGWPRWSADAHVIGFCQTLLVAIGWGSSVVLLRRLLVQTSTRWVLSSLTLLILSLAGRWLVAL
jgi:hypothetical protein